jgi:hypothetical protein
MFDLLEKLSHMGIRGFVTLIILGVLLMGASTAGLVYVILTVLRAMGVLQY